MKSNQRKIPFPEEASSQPGVVWASSFCARLLSVGRTAEFDGKTTKMLGKVPKTKKEECGSNSPGLRNDGEM